MADVLAGIRLFSTADTSGIRKMSTAITQFTTHIKDAAKDYSAINKIGAAFLGVGLAVEAGLGAAMAVSMEYEYIIQRFATISRASSADVVQTHDRLLTLSAGMATSAEGLAKLAVEAGRLGTSAAGVERFVLAGAKLSAISGGAITGESAVERIGRIANIFRMDLATSADKVASTFVGLSRASTATEAEISAVVSRTAELGRQLGFTIPQMAALAATAKDIGLEPRRAAGAVEMLFQSMTRHDNMLAFARRIKMTGYEFRQHLGKDPIVILERLRGSFKGLNQVMIENKLRKMGITDAAARTLVLGLSQNVDKLSKNLRIADEEFRKGTAANEAYNEILGSTKMTLQVFLNGVHAVAVAFGEILLPPFRLVLNIGIKFMQAILAIPKPLKVVMVILTGLVGVLFMAVGGTVLLVTGLALASAAFMSVATAMFGAQIAALGLVGALTAVAVDAFLNAAIILGMIPVVGTFLSEIVLLTGQLFTGGIALGEFTAGLYGMAAGIVSVEMLTGVGEALLIIAAAAAAAYVAYLALEPTITELHNSVALLAEPFYVLADGVRDIVGLFGAGGTSGLGGILLNLVRLGFLPIIIQIKTLAFGFRFLASILTGVARGFVALTKPIIEPFARLYNFVIAAVQPIVDLFDAFMGGGSETVSIFEGLASAAQFLFTYFTPVGALLRAVGTSVQVIGFIIENVVQGISDAFAGPAEDGGFLSEMSGLLILIANDFAEIGATVSSIFEPIRVLLTEFGILGDSGDGVLKAIGGAIAWLVKTWLTPLLWILRVIIFFWVGIARIGLWAIKVVASAIKLWATPLVAIVTFIGGLVVGIINAVLHPIEFIKQVWQSLVGFFSRVGSAIANAFNDAFGGSLGKIVQGIVAVAKAGLNALIDEANKLIGRVNKYLPKTAEIPSIPRLAEGGIVAKPTFAQIGEREPEVVTPLSKLPALMASVQASQPRPAVAPSEGRGGGGAMSITIPVTVMLDDIELGRAMVQVSEEQMRRAYNTKTARLSGVG